LILFVPKKIREPEKWGVPEQVRKQIQEQKEQEDFHCPHCDYIGKTALALASHMKKHKNERQQTN